MPSSSLSYVFICLNAIEHLIQTHSYQSAEFASCRPLLEVLKGGKEVFSDSVINAIRLDHGIVIYRDVLDRKGGLFFDLLQYPFFSGESDIRTITVFQKVLRTAIKYFGKQNFTISEIVKDSNLILFPLPYTSRHESFRIVMDRNSYRNGRTMNFLTVYFGGNTETSQPFDPKVLDVFYEEYKTYSIPEETMTSLAGCQIESFGVESISKLASKRTNLSFEEWKPLLTEAQSNFIFEPLAGARRLEGPAGTGKTLSLVLKCIYHLQESNYRNRFIFITHSRPTKQHIVDLFKQISPEISYHMCSDENPIGALLVTTVQEWCIHYLGTGLSDTEYLDKDAQASKDLQRFYIETAYRGVYEDLFSRYSTTISGSFLNFLEKTEVDVLLDMLQYELGVVIKGRAEGDIDNYKSLQRPKYGIPCESDVDKNFMFLIYQRYQSLLETDGQFDTDDIVLTALSSLNAPIWKRRREKEGFDACFIDETHLFNFNELSVFQYLNKIGNKNNILFAIDKSQYAGEILNRSEDLLAMAINQENSCLAASNTSELSTIFRSSPDIITLAYNVMSIGSTLFDNFDNPLEQTNNALSYNEEKSCFPPALFLKDSDDEMLDETISVCDRIVSKFGVSRGEILLVGTSSELTTLLIKRLKSKHKPIEQIAQMGDMAVIRKARKNNSYICANIDFVGGLEFSYVVVFGVDEKNVPPRAMKNSSSAHFSSYAWHRRMYVVLTRAKYGVCLIGNKTHGISPIFENALANNYITEHSIVPF